MNGYASQWNIGLTENLDASNSNRLTKHILMRLSRAENSPR